MPMIKMGVVASEQRKVRDIQDHQFYHAASQVECSMHVVLTEYTAPTVVGSHMSLLRPTTPKLSGDRRNGKPGEVSFPTFPIGHEC